MRRPLIKRIISSIVLITVGAALILFSVVNRHGVTVNFWPFAEPFEVRLFVVILGILTIGVFWGGLAAWFAGGATRRRGREAARRANNAENDLRAAKREIEALKLRLHASHEGPGKSLPPADAA